MQWVQTTGRTVDEAKDRALDQLGVDESEAEFEVLEEPKAGLFGRVRGEARIKARVRPTSPRPKAERRPRRRAGRGRGGGRSDQPSTDDGSSAGKRQGQEAKGRGQGDRPRASSGSGRQRRARQGAKGGGRQQQDRPRDQAGPRATRQRSEENRGPDGPDGGVEMTQDLDNAQQGEIVAGFVEGLLDAFGADGDVSTEPVDEEMVEVRVEGDDLGLLIGPKGRTLWSIQELARTVVQRQAAGGRQEGRVRVDVGGYRELRRRSLAEFTRGIADQVLAEGTAKSLEPMGAADRKVVHDTVNEIDGVSTVSEGEDPRRRVVIVPESAGD